MKVRLSAALGAVAIFVPVTQLVAQSPQIQAQQASASPDVKRGVEAWESGDYATAVKLWRPLAIKGDADAQFNLAQAYRFGRSVPMDLKAAEDWYRRAAAQGHLQAEDNLGLIMFQNGDRQNAMPMIRRSANRGDPRAQYVLATAMFNGDFAEKDWTTAYALMTRASATGLARASASLAQMDKFIPLEQRQKGLALARDMELNSSRPRLAAVDPIPAPPPPVSVQPIRPDLPEPVRTAPVPQSRAPLMTASRSALPPPRRSVSPADGHTPPPVDAAPEPQWQAPSPAANASEPDYSTPSYEAPNYEAPTYEQQPRPARVASRTVTPKPTAPKPVIAKAPIPKPQSKAQPKAIVGKGWRVQLGAFSEEGKAKAQWSQLKGRISGLGGLQPYLVKAANVTRLQAGPIASRADAERVCKAAQAAGQGCFPVAP